MINSIYFELLKQGRDEEPYYEDLDEELDIEDNLIYMPLQRTVLSRGELEIDVDNVEFAQRYIPAKALKEYADSDLYSKYPIAVSFTIKKRKYGEYRNTIDLSEGIIQLDCCDGRYHYSFIDGIEVAAVSMDNKVKLVYGFAKEESR